MVSALGRPFDLGMLYDRRSDKVILGKTLWSPDQLNAALNTVQKSYTNSDVFTETNIDDKTSALNIEASLKLSFLGGLVNIEGAAKYLDDRKTSKHQSRVVLKYETTTMLKELTMEHLGRGKLQHPEVLEEDIATDVVVGILYGAKAFMIFDKEVSVDESAKEVHGNMEVLVKALPGISVDGKGSVDMKEDQKSKAEKIQCKMYGDFRTKQSPTNFEEAVKVYKELPSLIGDNGENAVPVKVYLYPLSNLDSKVQRMVREISADLISKTCDVQEHVQTVVAECNDLLRDDVCFYFPTLKKQLSSFKNNVSRYKIFFQKKLLPLLPSIRGGGAEESELAEVLQGKEASPFAQSRMDSWVEKKGKESKKLKGFVRFLDETRLVNQEDVDIETFDPGNEHVVCCTFRISSEDDQILSMDAYLSGSDLPELKPATSSKSGEKSVNAKLRKTLKQFRELKSANEGNDAVKFLATDEPLSRDSGRSPGAFIYLYEEGELKDEDFCCSPKPEKPKSRDVRENAIEISWIDSNSSKNNIKEYKVQYKPEEQTTSGWMCHQVTCLEEDNQKASITGLQPGTNYLFRVCAVRHIIVSEFSEAASVSTKPTSPPGKPRVISSTASSITIDFTKPDLIGKDVKIEKYKIEWGQDGKTQASSIYTEDATTTFTIKNLQKEMSYVIQVTASCGDTGESVASSPSDPVTTSSLSAPKIQISKVIGLCELIQPAEGGKPAVYALPLSLVHEDKSQNLRKYEINLESKKTSRRVSSPPNKVIMVVGATGSGKKTTVNAMINHLLGVNWTDPYRFVMIREALSTLGAQGNQEYSQTQFRPVSCYTLHYPDGFKVNELSNLRFLQDICAAICDCIYILIPFIGTLRTHCRIHTRL